MIILYLLNNTMLQSGSKSLSLSPPPPSLSLSFSCIQINHIYMLFWLCVGLLLAFLYSLFPHVAIAFYFFPVHPLCSKFSPYVHIAFPHLSHLYIFAFSLFCINFAIFALSHTVLILESLLFSIFPFSLYLLSFGIDLAFYFILVSCALSLSLSLSLSLASRISFTTCFLVVCGFPFSFYMLSFSLLHLELHPIFFAFHFLAFTFYF